MIGCDAMDQTKDCTRELIAKAHNNDKEAREKLVTDNPVSYTHLTLPTIA